MRIRSLLLAALTLVALPAIVAAAIQGPVPCEGGKAGRYPCRAIDLASFIPIGDLSDAPNSPDDPSEWAGDVLGWRHESSGREFAILSLTSRAVIVEVTDPENPVILGDFARDSGGLGSMAIYEDHLYGIVGARIDIFDLTNLLTVSGPPVALGPVGSVATPIPNGLISINSETGYAYWFAGDVYVAVSDIVAFDLNGDPENPQQVMAWNPTSPLPRSLECVLYRGPDQRFQGHEICFAGAGYSYLAIYDVTDKAHPVRLSSTKYKHSNTPRDTALTLDHRFLLLADSHDEHLPGGNTRTFLWNLSSLTAPVYFKSHDGSTRARDLQLEVRGRYAFLANSTAGLRILDLGQIGAKKSKVREAGYFDVEPGVLRDTSWFGAWSADVLPSGTIIVGSVRQGLFVLTPRL